MIPSSILMEPLTECMILGLLTAWAVSFLFQWDPISFFLIHITLWFIMDAILIRVVQNGPLPFNKVEFLVSLQLHTVRNLHFLSENSTLISRENCRFFGWKTRENVVILDFLAVDNFDFTRKIVKKKFDEKLVKMLGFCRNWIFEQKFDFSNSVRVW